MVPYKNLKETFEAILTYFAIFYETNQPVFKNSGS